MSKKGVILFVDDENVVLNSLRTLLNQRFDGKVMIEIAESGEEALEIIDEIIEEGLELQALVADYIMPGMKGDELLANVHERLPNVRKILLTGQSDLAGVKRAINDAALYRFIEKPWSDEDLLLTLQNALHAYDQDKEIARQNEELKLVNEELKRVNEELMTMNEELENIVNQRTQELRDKNRELGILAVTDRLTGICNRLKLDEVFEHELDRTVRYELDFAVIILDIDHFKRVNDSYGHQVGDAVLVEISHILMKHLRKVDVPGRWGGEEFLIICPETNGESAFLIAEKLRTAIDSFSFTVVGHTTASFGVTSYRKGDDVKDMMSRADAALYKAKERGRNSVIKF
ncbi:MAG: diguanylate cyclase [Desulfamplus sp.]|nr:diguanylate cyclase [Desulfamplus sp.]MBF0412840.1 diguanylate cyclase [Desulfamplus sp.]